LLITLVSICWLSLNRCDLLFVWHFVVAVKLWRSIVCDVSKGKSSYIFYCTYVLFQGDYGAPMVYSNKLVGMYISGTECGNPDIPDIYTKVPAVCDWLILNARLYKISYVINWTGSLPGLQKMPHTYFATHLNN
jgi:hypothetical protein